MVNTNTHESFRGINPEEFIDQTSRLLLEFIKDGSAVREPCRLAFFIIFSFADLKRYRFHYWAAYPTFFNLPELNHANSPTSAKTLMSENQLEQLSRGFISLDGSQKAFFTVVVSAGDHLSVENLSKGVSLIEKKTTELPGVEQVRWNNFLFFIPYI